MRREKRWGAKSGGAWQFAAMKRGEKSARGAQRISGSIAAVRCTGETFWVDADWTKGK